MYDKELDEPFKSKSAEEWAEDDIVRYMKKSVLVSLEYLDSVLEKTMKHPQAKQVQISEPKVIREKLLEQFTNNVRA